MKWPQALIFSFLVFLLLSCRESIVKTKDTKPTEKPERPFNRELDSVQLKKNMPSSDPKRLPNKTKTSKPLDTLKPKIASQNTFESYHLKEQGR